MRLVKCKACLFPVRDAAADTDKMWDSIRLYQIKISLHFLDLLSIFKEIIISLKRISENTDCRRHLLWICLKNLNIFEGYNDFYVHTGFNALQVIHWGCGLTVHPFDKLQFLVSNSTGYLFILMILQVQNSR